MQTSLIISNKMNLAQLADLMGGYGGTRATVEEAYEMRELLVAYVGEGKTTDDVDEKEWLGFIDVAIDHAADTDLAGHILQ